MNWRNLLMKFLNIIKKDRALLNEMRDDLNSTISDTSKLLYRLEEAESKIDHNTGCVKALQKDKQDKVHNRY